LENLIAAPDDPAAWPAWRETLQRWREDARACFGGDTERLAAPEFAWVRDCITTHKLFLWDQRFHTPDRCGYRVDDYVDGFEARFGALDGVILWHAYPQIGFDDRNQFEFYRRMPGGLPGLRRAVDAFHDRGVRVLLDFNPWDRATRREDKPDHLALADLVATLDADGLYLDTMAEAAAELRVALDRVKPGVVFESQSFTPIERIGDHAMSWAEVYEDGPVPGVLRNVWYERRQMMHVVHRWMADHSGELQIAWMNGAGMMVWENVFGSWNGWSDRDAQCLRLWSAVRHRHARFFDEGHWTPLAGRPAADVFASAWDHGEQRLWTLVNRSTAWRRGVCVPVEASQASDLITGRAAPASGGAMAIDLPPRGLGAVLEAREDEDFLSLQSNRYEGLGSADDVARPRPVTVSWPLAAAPVDDVTDGMATVEAASWNRRVVYRVRENGLYDGASAPGCESHTLPCLHEPGEVTVASRVGRFAIDRRSVSQGRFHAFLSETGYRPRHPEAFLAGRDGESREGDPVVGVDLDDARAFARWLGRRLPTEAEWQRAAECGLLEDDSVVVWNWTEPEYSDGRTRFTMLKGGSAAACEGSDWYADGGPRPPAYTAKYLLLWPGLDRCGAVGFRTVVDLGTDPE